jgi:hypothetical protein
MLFTASSCLSVQCSFASTVSSFENAQRVIASLLAGELRSLVVPGEFDDALPRAVGDEALRPDHVVAVFVVGDGHVSYSSIPIVATYVRLRGLVQPVYPPVATTRIIPKLDCFQPLGIKRYTLGDETLCTSHYLKHWSRWCRRAYCFLVRSSCSLEGRLCALSYSYSAQDVLWWSFLPMSPKHFTCFLGCIGGSSKALVITSISGVLFLVSRCFP